MCDGMDTTMLESNGEESVLEEVFVLPARHCRISPNIVLEFAWELRKCVEICEPHAGRRGKPSVSGGL